MVVDCDIEIPRAMPGGWVDSQRIDLADRQRSNGAREET